MPFAFITAEIERGVYPERFAKGCKDIRLALEPSIGRKHRVKADRAVLMKGDPVIRENGIRCIGLCGVFSDGDVYVVVAERLYKALEFGQRGLLGVLPIPRRERLEGIVDGRLCVEAEIDGPDHEKMRCRLHMLGYFAVGSDGPAFRGHRGAGACSYNGNRRGPLTVRPKASG